MKEFFVGALLIVVGLWINENWIQAPKVLQGIILRKSNRMVYFASFILAPALVLAFFSAAILSGIHARINDLPDDAPVTLMDGFMGLAFTLYYGLGFHWFLPRPPWNKPRE